MDKGEKKVCFLTLVNQVNGPLGGRSREPNGLIREEEVHDGNGQQGEGHGLTHRQPYTTAYCSAKDTQISWGPAWTHIRQAECLLWLSKDSCETCVKCHWFSVERLS